MPRKVPDDRRIEPEVRDSRIARVDEGTAPYTRGPANLIVALSASGRSVRLFAADGDPTPPSGIRGADVVRDLDEGGRDR